MDARARDVDRSRPLRTIVRDGLGLLASTPALRSVTAAGALNLGGLGLLTVAFPFFALEELGAQRSTAGYMWAAFAAGSAIGALTLVRLQTRWPPERVVLGAITLVGCVMMLWPLAPSLAVALALIALAGLADGPGLAATFGARQRWTPPELLGQIFTTAASLKVGAFAVGAACAGPAVNTLGPSGTLRVAAGVQFVAVAAGLVLGGARGARSSDLEQDDRVHPERDREGDRPAVEVPFHQGAAAEGPRARAADAERTREPAVLARVQQHQEDQHEADDDLHDREEGVHGRAL
jgi:MFS family permease